MQMDVPIGGRAKALREGDGDGRGFGALKSRLFSQKCRNDAVDDLQHGPEQLGMGSEQKAQRDRE